MILTFKQAYERYFKGLIGINKLRDMVRQKQIPTISIPSKKTYFNSDAIEQFLETGVVQQVEPQQSDYGKIRQLKE